MACELKRAFGGGVCSWSTVLPACMNVSGASLLDRLLSRAPHYCCCATVETCHCNMPGENFVEAFRRVPCVDTWSTWQGPCALCRQECNCAWSVLHVPTRSNPHSKKGVRSIYSAHSTRQEASLASGTQRAHQALLAQYSNGLQELCLMLDHVVKPHVQAATNKAASLVVCRPFGTTSIQHRVPCQWQLGLCCSCQLT